MVITPELLFSKPPEVLKQHPVSLRLRALWGLSRRRDHVTRRTRGELGGGDTRVQKLNGDVWLGPWLTDGSIDG